MFLIAKDKNYNSNVTEVRDSDFKNAIPGIFNLTVGILLSIGCFTRKKCSGSVSYDSQFLSYGSENHFVTFDLTDTRPIVIEKNSSPVYFTKFKSVSNQQICIDLDRNIFVYE